MNQHTNQRAGRRSSLRHALLVGAVVATGLLAPAAAGASIAAPEPPEVGGLQPQDQGPSLNDDITLPRPCELLEGCGPDDEPEPEDPCEGEEPSEDCPGEPGGGEGEPEPEPEPEPVPEATVDPAVRATPNFTG